MARLTKKLRDALPVSWLAAMFIRVIGQTLRFEFRDEGDGLQLKEAVIFLTWHNRLLMTPYIHQRYIAPRVTKVLTSQSRDGDVITAVMKRFHCETIRGSSNKRPAAALREMVRTIRSGTDIAISPDGPRGPLYEIQPGAVKLAEMTGAPIILVHTHYSKAWRLKTWDKFIIPKPFSKAILTFSELIRVQRTETKEALAEQCAMIEKLLRAGCED